MSAHAVAENIRRLERWIVKRQAKQLDCRELIHAVQHLRAYHNILAAAEVMRNGGVHGKA